MAMWWVRTIMSIDALAIVGATITLDGKTGIWHCMQFDLMSPVFNGFAILQ